MSSIKRLANRMFSASPVRFSRAALIGIFLAAFYSPAFAAENAAVLAALESITGDDLQRHVDVLADDTFEGREAGSRGGRAAAGYLVRELAKAGLKPAGVDGTWFQPFSAGYHNILALLEGSDPELKYETILLGAHYDHVGYGTTQNSYGPTGYIHNGADDNASGIAALLETAEAFATLGQPPKRSILFALWDGEEKGLLGSDHWVDNPTVRLDQVRLALNLDMIGRLRNRQVSVYGTRTSWGLRRLVSTASSGDLVLNFRWDMQRNSDHWTFYQQKLPVLMLHTGLHDDYHRPSDDSEKLNVAGMQQISRQVFQIARRAGDVEKLRGFRHAVFRESASTHRQLETLLPPPPTRFGISWKRDSNAGEGLVVERVEPDSAAARAGIRHGDCIVEFDGNQIESGDDLVAAVLVATDPVEAKVIRTGAEADAADPETIQVELSGDPIRVGIAWREDEAEPGSVFLVRVIPGSPAAKAGLRVLDRIYQIEGKDFLGSDDFLEKITSTAGLIPLQIERRGKVQTVELQLPPGGGL